MTSGEFIKQAEALKVAKAEQAATSLTQVCKAQKAERDRVGRSLRRMDSAMVALHGNLDDEQHVNPEQFVQVLLPYTDSVLNRQELLDIFYKLDAKGVGHIKMRLNETEGNKARHKMEQQVAEIQKRKSAKVRLQNAVGKVQNMRRSITAMLQTKKSNKVAPCRDFDSIAPKPETKPAYANMTAYISESEKHPVKAANHDDNPSDSEEDAELALLQKRIADLKAAKEKQAKQEEEKQKKRQEKMEALKKEMEKLQNEVDED